MRGQKRIKESGRLIKGKTLEGINYCINQEEALKVFLDDGEVPLDNNATEGALRSFCLHKHAWKLIDSIDGAKSSAIVYSITETAKANNLNPFRYLEYVLTVMKDHQEDTDYRFMEGLLPWSEQLPEICRSKTKTTNVNRPPETAVKNTPVLMIYRVQFFAFQDCVIYRMKELIQPMQYLRKLQPGFFCWFKSYPLRFL